MAVDNVGEVPVQRVCYVFYIKLSSGVISPWAVQTQSAADAHPDRISPVVRVEVPL